MQLPTLPSTVNGPFSTLLLSYRTNNGNYIYQYKLPGMERHEWPLKTDIWCKHCSHPFDTIPIPIPASIDRKRGIYGVYNICCSVGCAAAWLRDHPFPDCAYQRSLLATMATEVFEIREPIRASPPQDRLIVYGGDLTIPAFRNFTNSGIHSLTRDVPFVQHSMVIEDHVPIPHQNISSCEEDILMQDEPMTASGSVPPGGLYEDFLKEKGVCKKISSNKDSTGSKTGGRKLAGTPKTIVTSPPIEATTPNVAVHNTTSGGSKRGRRAGSTAPAKKMEEISTSKRTSPGGGTLMGFIKQPPNKKTKI